MEAIKVRIQTMPGFANTLREGFPKMLAAEGFAGFYKALFLYGVVKFPTL